MPGSASFAKTPIKGNMSTVLVAAVAAVPVIPAIIVAAKKKATLTGAVSRGIRKFTD